MDRDIARKLLEVGDLPTLPVVMTHLLGAVEDENSSAQDVTAILEQDMAISARILRLANSAFYGLRFRVHTIQRAVIVVGFEAVRMLALATSVFDALSKHKQFAFDPEDFWLHSLGTAKAAQLLAKAVPNTGEAEACFTCGLLLNIGKYCLALPLKDEYTKVVKEAEMRGAMLHTVERESLGTTHAAAGLWMAERWRLPQSIAEVIGNQHRPEHYKGQYAAEVAIMRLASDAARAVGFGVAGDYAKPNLDPECLTAHGADPERVKAALTELEDHREEARQFLDVLTNH